MAPRFCAIWSREKVVSVAPAELGSLSCDTPRDRWVAFCAASMLKGRVLPLLCGRRCHERVPDLAGGVRLTSSGDSFSFVGDESMLASLSPSRPAESSRIRSDWVSVGSARAVVAGESSFCGGSVRRVEVDWLY